jgi:hypothetical protein
VQREQSRQAVNSARGFYFICYVLYYVAVFIYPNDLALAFQEGAYIYLAFSVFIHFISIFFFLTAGSNPGYVSETETPKSKKEKAQMFVRYDNFEQFTEGD